ncbi:MAG TPA: hypothetical protein VIN56_04115 [Candidatus Dormibacteraeota bacterium]
MVLAASVRAPADLDMDRVEKLIDALEVSQAAGEGLGKRHGGGDGELAAVRPRAGGDVGERVGSAPETHPQQRHMHWGPIPRL